MHRFAQTYLLFWFPKLPTCQAFNARINRLCSALEQLSIGLIKDYIPQECSENICVVDSMPIITCSGKRSGKVAPETTTKGYFSTRGMYYYGLKLHALGYSRIG